MSRTVKVSESRRVTTPLIFIFWPLAAERELVELVLVCGNAMEAEKIRRPMLSSTEENILNFGIAIDNSPCVESKRPAITRTSELVYSDDRFITSRCPALNASVHLFRPKTQRSQYPFR